MPNDANRANEILFAVLRLSPRERTGVLDRECPPALRPWVDAVLAAYDRPGRLAADDSPPTARHAPDADAGPTADYRPDDPTGAGVPSPVPDGTGLGTPATRADSGPATGPLLPDPPPGGEVPPGLVGGKYLILEKIGGGGMGTVYRARQREPVKREVALKLIKHGTDTPTVVRRFEAERQALALMDHPNIAKVYDGGTTANGQPFFVMELVNGVPITTYCDGNRLAPGERLELFVQVCRAVQHAHQKGVIHRDLKPGNILVTAVDGRPTPKVIDFGVAKAIDQPLAEESLNDWGAIVGTPAYMSPEQTTPGAADVDTRTDVYSLGVVLYELLAGVPPLTPEQFRRGAVLEILRMVREVEPEHLSTKARSAEALPNIAASRGLEPAQLLRFLRGDIDWIALKALAKDRERRYGSANDLAADILRYLGNEPVTARAPSRGYRLRKFVRRNRGAVLAAALVALALAAGVIGVVLQWREAVYQRDQKELARAEAVDNARVALEQRKLALDTVGQLVTTVRAELLPRPDLQGALAAVVRIARGSLDNIIPNPLVDISLNDTTRALIHDLKARTLRDQGEPGAAVAEFNRAADIFQAILDKAADGPDKEVVKKNLAIVLIGAGQTTLRTGAQADARGYYERAAHVLARVGDKSAADYRRILISLYKSLGGVTTDRKPREALENYRAALRETEVLADRERAETGAPSDETKLALQEAALLLGGAEGRVRNADARATFYARALALADERSKARPEDRGRRRALAMAHERIGDALLRSNKAGAATAFAAAAKLYRELAAPDPRNVGAQADLSRVLYSQGLAAERAGDNGPAAEYFRASLEIREARPNVGEDTVGQRDLMMSLARVGRADEAAALAEKVRAKLPKDGGALVDVACCYAVCSARGPGAGDEKGTRERYAAKALEALTQALDAGYGDKVNLETEPDLDGVRNRPAFKALVDRVPEP
jgi:serine/threonine protein kinase